MQTKAGFLRPNVHALETTCSGLRDQVSRYERLKEQIEEFQDSQMNIVNDKVAKLDADLLEMALHLEEYFYPHLLTTIFGQRWLLTHGLKLAVVKCLNSQEYLLALGAAISSAIEKGMQDGLAASIDHGKGMQDGLAAGIDHGKAGRSLADIVAYNPAAEANYNSTMQRLRKVEFPLLAELKSYKDASTADVMNLLCLEGPFADAPGMSDLQPDVEQLTLLSEASTSGSVSATVVTTIALSTTFAVASSVPPITIEDYEIVGTDGPKDAQGNGQGNVASFPTVEFEKEELDTTPERDPPS
ncbi:hypothetical protein Tco_0488168 [Tanacetum coccineum]